LIIIHHWNEAISVRLTAEYALLLIASIVAAEVFFCLDRRNKKIKAKATLPPTGHTPGPAALCRGHAFLVLPFVLKARTYAFSSFLV